MYVENILRWREWRIPDGWASHQSPLPCRVRKSERSVLDVKSQEMITVLFLFSMVCKIKMQELNALRMHSEELERLLQFAIFRYDSDRNRSEYLINEMVETLWYCT